MNAKEQTDPNTPPAPNTGRHFLQHLEDWWARQTKIAVATYFFGIIMWILGWSVYATNLAALKLHGHPSQAGERFFCEVLPWVTLVFIIVWTLLCFRWRKVRQGTKKVHPGAFLVTAWLSLFVTVSPCATATPVQTNTVPQMSQTVQVVSTPSGNNTHPNTALCDALLFIFYLLGTAIGLYIAWLHYCDLFGWCGHSGKKPPQSPGTNSNNVATSPKPADVNPSVALPSTIFYLVNGQVVSNSAGLATSIMPSLFNLNGLAVPNGSEIDTTTPGITIPSSTAVWIETNTYSDSILDPAHNYAAILNYSFLGSTNLLDWKEIYTAISWVNDNPTVPLVASIYYTNGVPETTNWSQIFLDQFHQPTNIVVYGVLPSCANSTFAIGAVRPADGITPPGGGGTNGVFSSSAQFFRLTCNTNDIVTSWP